LIKTNKELKLSPYIKFEEKKKVKIPKTKNDKELIVN